jgi:hypothetical protein
MGMKLALIPPMSLLNTADTNYHMVLPQLLSNSSYNRYYQECCRNPNNFVIMDNGAAEGETVSSQKLVNHAIELGVQEVVAPDVLGDASYTLRRSLDFVDDFGHLLFEHNIGIMYVLHGRTWNELYMGIHFATCTQYISSIGIPRSTFDLFPYDLARHSVASQISDRTNKPIHLLGMHPKYITEFGGKSWPDSVRGVDTSAPYNYTYSGAKIDGSDNPVSRVRDYFDLPIELFDEYLLAANINYLKGVVDV